MSTPENRRAVQAWMTPSNAQDYDAVTAMMVPWRLYGFMQRAARHTYFPTASSTREHTAARPWVPIHEQRILMGLYWDYTGQYFILGDLGPILLVIRTFLHPRNMPLITSGGRHVHGILWTRLARNRHGLGGRDYLTHGLQSETRTQTRIRTICWNARTRRGGRIDGTRASAHLYLHSCGILWHAW